MSYFGFKKDVMTGAMIGIDYGHHEIHDGDTFRVGAILTNVSNAASRLIRIKTPNSSSYSHWGSETITDAACQIEFYEGTIFTAASGTQVSTFNKNRMSANVASTLIYTTPTVSVLGTQLMQKRFGTGKTAGGEAGTTAEWILKADTNYLFKIINKAGGGGSLNGSWRFIWYEHKTD